MSHPIPACMAHLPVYQGLPVPYVAIWSGEMVGPQLNWTPNGLTILSKPEYMRRGTEGVLWLDTPDNRQGTPNFGGTHSTRQRICMRDGVCQVCGRKQNPKKLLWVVPDAEDQQTLHDEYGGMFINPPICPDCFKGALHLCPHLLLKGDKARVYKGTPRITGVHGTYVMEGNRTQIVYLGFKAGQEANELRFIMGRQYLTVLENEVEVTEEYIRPS